MAVKNTGATATKLMKPDYIVATLFTGTETDDVPTGDSYIIEDVVEDTTSIVPAESEKTTINCETSDSPIKTIYKKGDWEISTEIADTQSDLLKSLCGYKIDTAGKKDYAPSAYKEIYIKFDIVFKGDNGTMAAYVVPRVQLDSKVTIESLNSNLGRIALSGTANDIDVTIGSGENVEKFKSPFYIDRDYHLPE